MAEAVGAEHHEIVVPGEALERELDASGTISRNRLGSEHRPVLAALPVRTPGGHRRARRRWR